MTGPSIERVREGFEAAFARAPEGVWSAPGRVSVVGDHTDLHDGLAFGFAVPARTAVAIARRDDGAITIATDLTAERAVASLATLQPGDAMEGWKAYPLGMIWAVVQHAQQLADDEAASLGGDGVDPGLVGSGLDVFITSDLPIGGGLASSASACAAIGVALRDLWRLEESPMTLARLGHTTELRAAGAATGIADHVTVLHAQTGHDVFFDVRGRDVSLIEQPDLEAEGLEILVIDTRESHRNWSASFRERHDAAASVATALGRQSLREVRLDELDDARERLDEVAYRRARHVITEIQRTLDFTRILRTEGPAHVGATLRESQASLRDDFEVSTKRLDLTCDLADHLGAIGARMSGSGMGGSVLVLIHHDRVDALTESVLELYREHGWDEPFITRVTASEGARRDS